MIVDLSYAHVALVLAGLVIGGIGCWLIMR
jgi:hypothetical protein